MALSRCYGDIVFGKTDVTHVPWWLSLATQRRTRDILVFGVSECCYSVKDEIEICGMVAKATAAPDLIFEKIEAESIGPFRH